jgi:hypothetical protein
MVEDPIDDSARREAARMMGRARTDRKAEAVRKNGRLGGRPLKRLGEIPCTCGADTGTDHRSTCKRGRAITRRLQKGQALEW